MNKQAGFTLIELIVVIVILGILGAVALPKFVDLSDDAALAAAQGVAGALGAAVATNYAICKLSASNPDCNTGVVDCATTALVLANGALPVGGYTLAGTYSAVSGTVNTCTVSYKSKTADFTAIAL